MDKWRRKYEEREYTDEKRIKERKKRGGGGDEKVASNISVRRIKSKDHLKLTGSQ